MSNVKWVKLFHALAQATQPHNAEWKFLDSETIEVHGLLREHDLTANRCTNGCFQPFEYKWIEWIRFPRIYRRRSNFALTSEQDIDAL